MARIKEQTDEKLQKAYDYALSCIRESENSLTTWQNKCLRWYQQWAGVMEKSLKRTGRSNIFFNKIYSLVETVVPIQIAAILQQEPPIWVKPRGINDVDTAPVAEKVLSYYQEKSGQGLFMDLLNWQKLSDMYGVGVMKTGWITHYRKAMVEEPVFNGFNLDWVEKEKEIPYYDGLFHRILEPGHIIIAPGAIDYIENGRPCEYCGDYSYYTDSAVKSLGQAGRLENVKMVLKKGKGGHDDTWHRDKLNKIGIADQSKEMSKFNEMIELWFWWDIDGDGTDEYCQMILLNRKYPPVKFTHTVYKHLQPPYVRLPHTQDVNRFIAKGIIEPCEPYQIEWNVYRNLFIDNANLSLNQMSKRRSNILPDQIVFSPGHSIEVMEQDDIEFFAPPPLGVDSDRRYKMTERDFEETSGIAGWKMGVDRLGAQTLGESYMIQEASNARATLPIMITSKYALPRLSHLDLENIKQFSSADIEIRITDRPPQFLTSTPEQRSGFGSYDFKYAGYTQFSSKALRIQQLLNFTREILGNPALMQTVQPYQLVKRISQLLFPEDWDALLVHPEAQNAMSNLLGAAGGGGVGGGGMLDRPEASNMQDILKNLSREARPEEVQYAGGQ